MRILFFVFLLTGVCQLAIAGNGHKENSIAVSPQKTAQARPNVPGDLIIDLGVSLFNGGPDNMDLYILRSRAVNIYYLYHITLGQESHFSINPGLGLGMENYNFADPVTLAMTNGETNAVQVEEAFGELDLRKSKLSVNYLDIPVELRFNLNKVNHDRGLRIAVGGRVGVLIDAHTKVKFEQNDDVKKFKTKQDFSLNKIRYSVHGRLGVGSFNAFYYANLAPLFKDSGPDGTEDMNTFMAGISFTLF